MSTQERVCEVVSQQMGIEADALTSDTNLADDLGADSLDITELVMELEEEFDIDFPDADVEDVKTIADIVKAIDDRL